MADSDTPRMCNLIRGESCFQVGGILDTLHCMAGRPQDEFHERNVIVELSRLIETERGEIVRELWDHGEAGIAIDILVTNLSDGYIPLTAARRAELATLAHHRSSAGDQVEERLRWCPDPDDEDPPWEVVEDTKRAGEFECELYKEIGPDHPLHGRKLSAWLTCTACDDVLVGLDIEEACAGRVPFAYAVVHPTWIGKRERLPCPDADVFSSPNDALDRLMRCWE